MERHPERWLCSAAAAAGQLDGNRDAVSVIGKTYVRLHRMPPTYAN